MANLRLDPEGHLIDLLVVPPERDDAAGPFPQPDWPELLAMAGLDMARLQAVQPAWNPLLYCDTRSAWEGSFASQPAVPIRIEAGGYHGKPSYFRIIAPWDKPWRMEEWSPLTGQRIVGYLFLSLFAVVLMAGLLIARRNLRLGRGDRRGAFRLACVVFLTGMLSQMILLHHVADVWWKFNLILQTVTWMLFMSGLLWLVYIALEPYARKLWPEILISWSRLLAGRFRDPRIGRDILIGGVASVALHSVQWLHAAVPEWLGLAPTRPMQSSLNVVEGLRSMAGQLVGAFDALMTPVFVLFFLLLLRVLLRKQWAAVVVFLALGVMLGVANWTNPLLDMIFSLSLFGIMLFVLIRYGLLAVLVMFLIPNFPWNYPLDFSTWYAGRSLLILLAAIALVAYGFYISLAGRPIFHGTFLPE